MNSGAAEILPIVAASFCQSSSRIWPLRMFCSGTRASADSRRMVISLRLISREKITEVRPCLIDADRAMSSASVDLPMAGRAASDDHLARVQAVGEPVEVGEAGGHADHPVAAVPERPRSRPACRCMMSRQRQVVLAGALLGDRVDLGLGAVDQVVDVAAVGRVAELDDPGAGLDQPAQHGPLAHDPRVVAGVGGGRHRRDQGVQVRRAADPRRSRRAWSARRRR